MHRLFVALRPPPDIRLRLSDTMAAVPHARWQDDDQMHLTLRFVGAVERPVAEDVAAALASVHAPAPVVALAGVGRFDTRGRTDTLWAAVTPHDALAALHRKVDRALAYADIAPDRRAYLPHITLARLPRTAGTAPEIDRWLAANAALASDPFALPHLALFESHLTPDGAHYETIARWPLAGASVTP